MQVAALRYGVDGGFIEALANHKLTHLKLSSAATMIEGFRAGTLDGKRDTERLRFTAASFVDSENKGSAEGVLVVQGRLVCVNSHDDFLNFDREACLGQMGSAMWAAIVSGDPLKHTSVLRTFTLLAFIDLKTNKTFLWLGVPVLHRHGSGTIWKSAEMKDGMLGAAAKRVEQSGPLPPYFCMCRMPRRTSFDDLTGMMREPEPCIWKYGCVSLREGLASFSACSYRPHVALVEPAGGSAFSWVIQNFIVFLSYHYSRSKDHRRTSGCDPCGERDGEEEDDNVLHVRLIELRGTPPFTPESHLWHLERRACRAHEVVLQYMPHEDPSSTCPLAITNAVSSPDTAEMTYDGDKGSGNDDGADTHESQGDGLARAAALNLRLMTWRHSPGLNVDRLMAMKCLIVGAGTLGCAVARALIGWGITEIAFVDRGNVAPSNPTRQCLFTTADVGLPKALAAARRLNGVLPTVHASGHVLDLPMPGHVIAPEDEAAAEAAMGKVDALVRHAHVVFSLTDSREGRWLITVLCARHDRLCITAALGFDTFLVMRHGRRRVDATSDGSCRAKGGLKAAEAHTDADADVDVDVGAGGGAEGWVGPQDDESPPPLRSPPTDGRMQTGLGCYFCADVVAPADSSRGRPLDMQCTVSRPGLSHIASGYAVELFVSAVEGALQGQHKGSGIGVPHQIRGTLSPMEVRNVTLPRYAHCVACSDAVLGALLESEQEAQQLHARQGSDRIDPAEKTCRGDDVDTTHHPSHATHPDRSERDMRGDAGAASMHSFWQIVFSARGSDVLEQLSGTAEMQAVADRLMPCGTEDNAFEALLCSAQPDRGHDAMLGDK